MYTDRRPSVISRHHPPCDELFDSVVQSLFGIGLHLEHCMESTEDAELRAKIDASIHGLHGIIGQIRERGDLHGDSQ
jgi:hypothetical protein